MDNCTALDRFLIQHVPEVLVHIFKFCRNQVNGAIVVVMKKRIEKSICKDSWNSSQLLLTDTQLLPSFEQFVCRIVPTFCFHAKYISKMKRVPVAKSEMLNTIFSAHVVM